MKTKGITMSMSRKGTPADNASIESFHSSLKSETFPVSKTGVSPEIRTKVFLYNRLFVPFTSLFSFMLSQLMAPVLPENGG
ncbi:hypothetical protein EUA35_21545 [Bacillus subtilis]|nr:hypothetical protein EUA35_21545 [Bacillus subtilis]